MKYYAKIKGNEHIFDFNTDDQGRLQVTIDGRDRTVDLQNIHGRAHYSLLLEGRSYEVLIDPQEEGYNVLIDGYNYTVGVEDERERRFAAMAPKTAAGTGEMIIKSPMPGLVGNVAVSAGDEVVQGQRLLILEAMKMENELRAPRAGTVKAVHVQKGDKVEQNKVLLVLV